MRIFRSVVGMVDTNCYIAYDVDREEAIIVDPASRSDELDSAIRKLSGFKFQYILLTHGHFDHIGATSYYKRLTDAKVVIHEAEKKFIFNNDLNLSYEMDPIRVEKFVPYKLLKDGDKFEALGTEIEVIHTPGHTCGSCCYLIDSERIIFTGDTVMRSAIGRTDFPTGNAENLYASIKKLNALEGDYTLYTGHMDPTTLDRERKHNNYFKEAIRK